MLTPGRYVGAAEAEEDDVPFEERFAALKATLAEQFAEAEELMLSSRQNWRRLVSMGEWAEFHLG